MTRRAALLSRSAAATARRAATAAPADRPRERRNSADATGRAVVRASLHHVEMRTPAEDGSQAFRAYASVTETPYDMWDMFGPYTEEIASTAFDVTLAADPDVVFLLNHGGMTLARTTSGTLTLGRDDTGLFYEPRLDPRQTVARDVLLGIERRDLTESSFAFRIERGTWSPDYTAYRIEQLTIDRGDVSIVNYGANPTTGDYPIGAAVDVDALDVDTLDDAQALALAQALEQRTARRSAARAATPPGAVSTMTRAELDALDVLAQPHPLSRVRD